MGRSGQHAVTAALTAAAVAGAVLVASTAFATPPLTSGFGAPSLGATATLGTSATSGAAWGSSATEAAGSRTAMLAVLAMAAAGAALIVQNKGGGHGELGYHLALKLAKDKGLKVTMINDSAAKKSKPPFNSYADLEAAGVEVKWAALAEEGALASAMEGVGPCDYVFDNQNVCTKDVQKAVAVWSPKAYAYVSSGGMYKPVKAGPLLETGDVKEDNEQLSLEKSAADAGLAWSAFRPQYIYGPKTNKPEYLDWFLDRITRGAPILVPGDGSGFTTLTNAEDAASMLASVVGKEAEAKGQVFNCASDVLVSHIEVVDLCAKAAGKDAAEVRKTVVYYDPAALKGKELPKGGKFPFRETSFGVSADKAKSVLGWTPTHKLEEDMVLYVADYKRLGKDQGDIERSWDEAVLATMK
eukprot:CAMPEP_0183402152 /NCGR_PEP_ID=MMETSP0370-20130417/13711_1 /TAXON_ID=268820 /ORGANISM="Peridinium aciculiferum, Strain PAER-2" /LENGTH=412 /DNA_ID=CAMNT_0025583691 /DNA_START=60 /DNA_END=1298 /DNA_ORIENTATION=+